MCNDGLMLVVFCAPQSVGILLLMGATHGEILGPVMCLPVGCGTHHCYKVQCYYVMTKKSKKESARHRFKSSWTSGQANNVVKALVSL